MDAEHNLFQSVEEFVGFDLGHGESAMTSTTLYTESEPKVIEILPNKRAIITAVAEHPYQRHSDWRQCVQTKGPT